MDVLLTMALGVGLVDVVKRYFASVCVLLLLIGLLMGVAVLLVVTLPGYLSAVVPAVLVLVFFLLILMLPLSAIVPLFRRSSRPNLIVAVLTTLAIALLTTVAPRITTFGETWGLTPKLALVFFWLALAVATWLMLEKRQTTSNSEGEAKTGREI